ncbi:serine protease [Acinetobacter sp. SwsAc4]|uniref:S1 family serine peptidase n=1 Tax=Acinetobacter sp. SwsAc4 TaxID=2749437 RepID=UPI0021166291|nr:serine protease [Acinetobacter sp. SwsAc4]
MYKYHMALMGILWSIAQISFAQISPQPRIINGNIASEAQIPWQVALITSPLDPYQSYICSGSLVADRWVVTAAHCIEPLEKQNSDYYILIGAQNLQSIQLGQIIKVKKGHMHEKYNNRIYDNDLALLELESAVDFIKCGKNCQTIDIINPTLEKQNALIASMTQIAGWGVLEDCDNSQSLVCQHYAGQMMRNPALYPTTLRYTTLKLANCLSSSLYSAQQITQNMLCAESPMQDSLTDACYGDSGAGLTINNLEKPYLLGIASWGVGCAKVGYPGVYTRVTNYSDWINNYLHPSTIPEQKTSQTNQSGGGSVGIFMILLFVILAITRGRFIKSA